MADAVNICLVGTNNFGASHLGSIRRMEEEGLAKQTCAVIRRPEVYAEAVADYQARGVRLYDSYAEMLQAERGKTQLIALPVAIPDHAETTIAALEAGYDVLLEKPPAPVIQQLDAMLEAERRTGHFCCVGFQNQSKGTTRAIKELICEGKFGAIMGIQVLAEWVRLDSYYDRNDWAGKIMYEGKYCLDGPTCNALAHYLFNALYWSSHEWGQAANPRGVRAEMYHAHPIESEDTACISVLTDTGVQIGYLVTLAGWAPRGPITRIVAENGICWWTMSGEARILWHDGAEEILPDDGAREHDEVFRNCIRTMQGVDSELNCPLAMTRPYVLALNGAWESAGMPVSIPEQYVTREPRDDSVFTGLNGISELLDASYDGFKTFYELGAPWAVDNPWFELEGYTEFRRTYPQRI